MNDVDDVEADCDAVKMFEETAATSLPLWQTFTPAACPSPLCHIYERIPLYPSRIVALSQFTAQVLRGHSSPKMTRLAAAGTIRPQVVVWMKSVCLCQGKLEPKWLWVVRWALLPPS